ncbi:MAG: signal peptide peptidase SppA [Myxococcota bacterium]
MSTPPPARPKRSRSSTLILLALTGLAAFVFLAALVVVAVIVGRSGPEVADGTFLEVRLSGEIPDAPVVGGIVLDPDDAPLILTDITGAIRHAAEDDRIDGMLLVLDGPQMGWAGVQELRTAIGVLRAADKPCAVYAESYSTGTYYLASACDRIVMAPTGIGLVTGLSASTTFYAGAMEKLGVHAQMLHVGDFKSAVEPFERTEPSEPAAEAMNYLLDSIWHQWVVGVAEARGKTEEEVQQWVDQPSLPAAALVERGMIDAVAYPDQIRARIDAVAEDGWAASLAEPLEDPPDDDAIADNFTPLRKYVKAVRGERASHAKKIAVVYAQGPIVSGEAEGGLFASQAIADRTFRGWIDAIRDDDSIAAVVLRVNSPGGSALASDMMWHELERLKATGRPLVVSMGDYAASGGYYISAPADWIVAEPATLTGSIGVFGGKLVFDGTYEKLGLTQAVYNRGEQADLLSPMSLFSEEGKSTYQAFLDDFYETFLSRVGTGRDMERDAVHEVAQGRVWTGEQGLDRGLVDELGGLDVAVAKAAELAELQDYGVKRWPAEKTLFEVLLEDLDGSKSLAPTVSVPGVDASAVEHLLLVHRILSDGGPAALLPGDLVVH